MNTITFLLCVFTKQVISQTNDTFPARIFAQQKTITEDSDLYVTCSTFGIKKQTMVYVYLCKDHVGINVVKQEKEQYDNLFIIQRVVHHHSGYYSCVYSKTKYEPSVVVETGSTKIQILVIPSFLPADISVARPSTVSEGDNVEFRCTFSGTLQTLGECQLIQSYLRRNETIVQVRVFNVTRMEATFTIEGAVMRDSGHYSCVVLPSKCIKEHEETLYGNNTVLIEVKVSLFVRGMVFGGIISLMLLIGVCLWMIRNKQGRTTARKSEVHLLHNSCAESQQPGTHMLEEQQEQTEGEDLETLDSDSFSMEEEEGFQNDQVVEDSTCYDVVVEEEGVYSVADDPPASTCMYAASFKRKNKCSPDFTII